MNELARTLTGYVYILRNKKGKQIGLAWAPPGATAHLTEEEKRRLPLITPQGDFIPAVPEGEWTDFRSEMIIECICCGKKLFLDRVDDYYKHGWYQTPFWVCPDCKGHVKITRTPDGGFEAIGLANRPEAIDLLRVKCRCGCGQTIDPNNCIIIMREGEASFFNNILCADSY